MQSLVNVLTQSILHLSVLHLVAYHLNRTTRTGRVNWRYHPRVLMESPSASLSSTTKCETWNSPRGGMNSLGGEHQLCYLPHITLGTPTHRRGRARHLHLYRSRFPLLCWLESKKKSKRRRPTRLHRNRALKIIWGSENPWPPQAVACIFLCLNEI